MNQLACFIRLTAMRRNSIGLVRSARWAANLVWRNYQSSKLCQQQ